MHPHMATRCVLSATYLPDDTGSKRCCTTMRRFTGPTDIRSSFRWTGARDSSGTGRREIS